MTAVGDRVRIERDETRYPSKGTWPRFRGKTGTVVEMNLGEYGVVFGKVYPRTDGRGKFHRNTRTPIAWFQPHEVTPVGAGTVPQPSTAAATALLRVALLEKELTHV
jgi:hypothetical protein